MISSSKAIGNDTEKVNRSDIRILLVNPAITLDGFNSYDEGLINHGIYSIATCVKEAGYNIIMHDLRSFKGWKDFTNEIIKIKPHLVATGAMSVDFENACTIFKLAKKIDKRIITVIGGIHVSIRPSDALNANNIDYIVTGEGEISFIKLIDDLFINNKTNERLIVGERPDLNALPFIDREFLPYKEQFHPIWNGTPPWMTIIVGRGCTFRCKFCQPAERILFGDKVRRRSVDNVIEELIRLEKTYHFNYIHFHDDCITESKTWTLDFCKKYVEKGFKQKFAVAARADIITKNEDMISILKSSGCDTISIGIESGSQKILDFLGKGTTVEQNIKAAEICKKYGIKVVANYMYGIPTETKEDIIMTAELIKKIDPNIKSCAYFTPYPGCELSSYCEERDLIVSKEYKDLNRYPNKPKVKGIDYKFIRETREKYGEIKKENILRKIKMSISPPRK